MTHDPLCPVVTITKVIDSVIVLPWTDLSTTNLGKTVTYEEGECVCDLIARVREDQHARSLQGARVEVMEQDSSIGAVDVSTANDCLHDALPDVWRDRIPHCRTCDKDMSSTYEMGD